MKSERLCLWLEQMIEAAGLACSYVEEMDFATFESDRRTQQAVVLNLLLLGEIAAKFMEKEGVFVAAHPEIPWTAMKGMRNRIAHGYFELDLKVVWDTVASAVPALAAQLPGLLPTNQTPAAD
ncbi:MAG: DUF86 domain-containing protein [Candidatus Competibacter sp.]|jgi:uncharacterized protein with HEPN domain|nr:DUF86 domain-containing protein [Candidatus Competibacter sp.]